MTCEQLYEQFISQVRNEKQTSVLFETPYDYDQHGVLTLLFNNKAFVWNNVGKDGWKGNWSINITPNHSLMNFNVRDNFIINRLKFTQRFYNIYNKQLRQKIFYSGAFHTHTNSLHYHKHLIVRKMKQSQNIFTNTFIKMYSNKDFTISEKEYEMKINPNKTTTKNTRMYSYKSENGKLLKQRINIALKDSIPIVNSKNVKETIYSKLKYATSRQIAKQNLSIFQQKLKESLDTKKLIEKFLNYQCPPQTFSSDQFKSKRNAMTNNFSFQLSPMFEHCNTIK